MSLVKVKEKYQVTLPVEVRRKARLAVGDFLEASVKGKLITLTPKSVVNRDFKAQLENRLAESLEDVRKGRTYGPFDSAEALVRSLHRNAARVRRKPAKTR